MTTPEHERLLNDLLAAGEYPAFRAKLQGQLRQQLRRRRWQQRAPYLALAASIVLLAALFLVPKSSTAPASIHLVQTKPLEASSLVQTTHSSLARVQSTSTPPVILTASHAQPIHRISDQELLDLFPGSPVALVSLSDGRKHLLFLDQENPTTPH